MDRDEQIGSVIRREWLLFQQVENIGGRASCQDMPETFSLMRSAQYAIWSDAMIESWSSDLAAYERAGGNPIALKYAYMMESTHPDEYALIRDSLPEVSAHARELVEKIVALQLGWGEELQERWPAVAGRGRALRTAEDTPERTSQETYARGELSTYSERTLELMLEHFKQARERGENLQAEAVLAEARALGYESLDALEEALR